MKKISLLIILVLIFNMFCIPSSAAGIENIKIESILFYDEFNNVYLNPGDEEKTLTPCVVVSKDVGEKNLDNLQIVAATYQNDGSLCDTSIFKINNDNLLHGETIYGFDRRTLFADEITFPENGYAKAYLFENISNIIPYTNSVGHVLKSTATQPTGKLKLDVDDNHFKNLINDRFEIKKEAGVRKYSHNATYEKLFDTQDATTVYLSSKTGLKQYPVYKYGYGYDNSTKVGMFDGSSSGGSCFQGPIWYFQYTDSITSTQSTTYNDLLPERESSEGIALRWRKTKGGSNSPGFRNFGGLWSKGNSGDTVLSFKAPFTGTVKITGSPNGLVSTDTTGIMFRISKNDNTEVIFPKTMREGIDTISGWSYYNASTPNASTACEVNCVVNVKKGDYIRFIMSATKYGNGADLKWSPTVEYTSITGASSSDYTKYDDAVLVSKTADTTYYAPYDAKKKADLNIVNIPVVSLKEGQTVSVESSNTSILEYVSDNNFKVKGASKTPVVLTVKILENDEEVSTSKITVYCVNIMALTSTSIPETRSGLEKSKPINAYMFAKNINDGVYKTSAGTEQKNFIINVIDDVYSGDGDCSISVGTSSSLNGINLKYNINSVIRSDSPSGFTWMGRFLEDVEYETNWIKDGALYKRSINVNGNVSPVNIVNTDNYGMPLGYTLKETLEECQNQKGSYYQNEYDIYINPFENEVINNVKLLLADNVLVRVNGYSRWLGKLMFENIGFMPSTLNTANEQIIYGNSHSDTTFAFFGCKFFKGKSCALSIAAQYNAFLFDCVSAYASTDGLNYHSNNDTTNKISSSVVEVNCISYNNGAFNQIAGGTNKNNSNNSSTAHDSMYVLRVGGKYWNAQGGVVADVGGTKSITIGCEIYAITTDTYNQPTAYMFSDIVSDTDTNSLRWENPPKYIIDCLATGTFVRNSVAATENTYVLDLCGSQRTVLINKTTQYDMKTISWNDIIE